MLRSFDRGQILYGGSPRRFLKLSGKGAVAARSIVAGETPEGAKGLEDRLVDAGMIDPRLGSSSAGLPLYAVVIPHFNDPDGLRQTLRSLASANPASVVVVDDGSSPSVQGALNAVIHDCESTLACLHFIALDTNQGPATARNHGVTAVEEPVIVFVDTGVVASAEAVEQAVQWVHNGASAAAPVVRSAPGDGYIARYEQLRSPLDMTAVFGTSDVSAVGIGQPVSYVPSALLAVCRTSFESAGAMDENLRFGEDVDLIWRVTGSGARVVFDPSVQVLHEPRSSLGGFVRQRSGYGRSAGSLGLRHGSAVAPAFVRPGVLAAFVLPVPLALLVTAGSVGMDLGRLVAKFRTATGDYPGSGSLAVSEGLRSQLGALRSLVRQSTRTWWPVSLLLLIQPFSSRLRRRAAAAVALQLLTHAGETEPKFVPLALVDDLAYGTGVWMGAVRSRSLKALLPRLK